MKPNKLQTMKARFTINYKTAWGQQVYISGNSKQFGNFDIEKAVPMNTFDGIKWELDVEADPIAFLNFEYKYLIVDERNHSSFWEFGANRILQIDAKEFVAVECRDFWRPQDHEQNSLFTAPFKNAFFNHSTVTEKITRKKASKKPTLRFQLIHSRVPQGHIICILGSGNVLGNWKDENVIPLESPRFGVWEVDLQCTSGDLPLSYKYGLYHLESKKVVSWEAGENRIHFKESDDIPQSLTIKSDGFYTDAIGNWKGAGVAIPVFSIRTEKSSGVGEFTDLKLMADWSAKNGLKLIQILPVNDTVASKTWVDSYPYAAISVFALHPIYASIQEVGSLKDKKQQAEIESRRKELNSFAKVDYEAVMDLKSSFFEKSFQENKSEFLASKAFQEFYNSNKHWLQSYAVFCFLRDKYGSPDFTSWPEMKKPSPRDIAKFADEKGENFEGVALYYYQQFHLDKQLKEATAYARGKGVVVKGDIPIGIYRYSVDAWVAPHLYNMDGQAGAPPDDFSVSGQNWGFPAYNWHEMKKDDYAWWKQRLVKLSDYFDVFRIDHILGFFRIWEIPYHAIEGILGKFNPSIPFTLDEIHSWGLPFDFDRFCKPYIRDYMLPQIFGEHVDFVKEKFLKHIENDVFELKNAFATLRQVKEFLEKSKLDVDVKRKLLYGMYQLINNVLFYATESNGTLVFDPRISLHSTYSYNDLEAGSKGILNAMYEHYFYKRHNDFWRQKAMQKLPALKSATDMLICGEDLGMVPESVPGVMKELAMLSLAVQRMPNDPKMTFWHPSDTAYLSVTTTSSHDSSTLRAWWEEDRSLTQRFFNEILGNQGGAPFYCEPWVVNEILNQHMWSPSMWAIFPLQDLLALDGENRLENPYDERINVPAISQHYWRYRMHLSVEKLLKLDALNQEILHLVKSAGR